MAPTVQTKMVIIVPRNTHFAAISINDSDEKLMKYEELYTFLVELMPDHRAHFAHLLIHHQKAFIAFVESNTVQELTSSPSDNIAENYTKLGKNFKTAYTKKRTPHKPLKAEDVINSVYKKSWE